MNNLTKEISQASPEEFGPIQQMDVLRRKAKIDDVLKNVQAIFSVPSFFIIAVNILKCGSVFEILSDIIWEKFILYWHVEVVLHSITSFCCLFIVPWVAGGLPIQMKQLKQEFIKKVRSRILYTRNLGEIQPKRNGIRSNWITPRLLSTNRRAELYRQTLKTKFKYMRLQPVTLHEKHCALLFRYSASLLSTGKIPSKLLFGESIRTNLNLIIPVPTED
ncbi:uncharacterized protein NPIL_173881 [Nephila pilipes]|uniref:Uncharacterized protein n=1 Tax=Nephila pilipes TaxID=299642 RepID=A0A8X6QV34_NEPPI|nr:uncharacterized protein NPIL_173881 [Nephila pilipes]